MPLTGPDGLAKPLIQRSWDAAMAVRGVDRVVVATDDDRIAGAVRAFGGEVVMTPASCENGTARCAAAIANLAAPPEIVVNLQGDAPLTPPWFVEDLVTRLRAAPDIDVATPVLPCDGAALAAFREDRRNGRVGGTTAVFDRHWRALYFSKEVIPYTVETYEPEGLTPVWHHVGVYAYRPRALALYPQLEPGPLERLEGLEQLRFIENGHRILCVAVAGRGRKFWELNNPEDVDRVEAGLAEIGAP